VCRCGSSTGTLLAMSAVTPPTADIRRYPSPSYLRTVRLQRPWDGRGVKQVMFLRPLIGCGWLFKLNARFLNNKLKSFAIRIASVLLNCHHTKLFRDQSIFGF
jgi:hypothetical protein